MKNWGAASISDEYKRRLPAGIVPNSDEQIA